MEKTRPECTRCTKVCVSLCLYDLHCLLYCRLGWDCFLNPSMSENPLRWENHNTYTCILAFMLSSAEQTHLWQTVFFSLCVLGSVDSRLSSDVSSLWQLTHGPVSCNILQLTVWQSQHDSCHMANGNVNTGYFPKSGLYIQLFYMKKD